MKKILLTIFILFNFSFAGEGGYIMLELGENNIPLINDEIKIEKKSIIINDTADLNFIIKKYRESSYKDNKKCGPLNSFLYSKNKEKECNLNFYKNNNYFLKNDLIVKILNIEKYEEWIFLKVIFIKEIQDEYLPEIEKNVPIIENTLCDSVYSSVFSCDTENNKIISLCKNNNNTLSYKFGTKDKIELEYSSKENDDINKYYTSFINDGMHNYVMEINFIKNKYNYTVYKYTSNNGFNNLSGVMIKKGKKRVSEVKCKYPFEDNLRNYDITKFNILNLEYFILGEYAL